MKIFAHQPRLLFLLLAGMAFLGFTEIPSPGVNTLGKFFTARLFLPNHSSNHHRTTYDMTNHDYDKAWREIDSLEQRGLPKSALEKTEALLDIARRENVPAQIAKCLMYRGKYQSQLEEDGLVKAIFRLQQEVMQAGYPLKPLLQSMLAELYQNYLGNNYWRFQNRTQTQEFKNEDIRTWSIEQLTDKAAELYWESLSDARLSSTPIDEFKPILTDGRNDEGLRPTLYDFLAHRAIDYFMDERTHLTQPAYKFYIDNERAFAKAEDFVKWKIETRDTSSQKLKTLLLFQQVLAFRLEDKTRNPAAKLDADLKRLTFAWNNAVLDTKDAAYLKALENLMGEHAGTPAVTEVLYAMAVFYQTKGLNYKPQPGEDPKNEQKWFLKKAHDLCSAALEIFPTSFGAKMCSSLKSQIEQPTLEMATEIVNLPDKPFLLKIDYRNLTSAHLKLIRFDAARRDKLEKLRHERDANEKIIAWFNSLSPLRTWQVSLPGDGDFHLHTTEVKIDKLPFGQYLVLMSDKPFSSKENPAMGYLFTNVSNIGYWQRQDKNNESEFVVFDRQSGKPLQGVTAEFFATQYNAVFRKYDSKKVSTARSDANGFIKTSGLGKQDRSYQVLFCLGKDTLFTGQGYYSSSYREKPQRYQSTTFFLDRAIYRPGQTVYFKGIALEFDEKRMPAILPNQTVTVTLRDANWQEVSKQELKTNEYGTFSGTVNAPRTGLLGNMQLVSSIGGQSHYFKVEEYKRPRFEVTFEPLTGSFRLNDTVVVSGKAQAYAGSNVDGAQVTWRVVREVRFPWWFPWYKGWFPWLGETMEIANGVSQTDAEGRFDIRFAALPDRSIPKDKKPEFSYTVYADVTDITGETQSNETYITVGYISLRADVSSPGGSLDASVNVDSLRKFVLKTENLNGQFEPAQGTLTLESLKSPGKIFLDRMWDRPDKPSLSESDFKRDFPYFAWGEEDQPSSWPIDRRIFEENFDTKVSKEVDFLAKVKLLPGFYALTLKTKDKYGEPVEVKKYFSAYHLPNPASSRTPYPAATTSVAWHVLARKSAQLADYTAPVASFEPGETAGLIFAANVKQLPLLLEIERDGNTLSRKWLTIADLQSSDYLVREEDRGNVHYHVSYAQFNRSFNFSAPIAVPWSNKDLSIEYSTFRDKLKPGQQEEWVLKIKGPKGDKVAAEMVAGMYDASLDLFAPNSWGLSVFPNRWSRTRYLADSYSTASGNWLQVIMPSFAEGDYRDYKNLNWFNWYFYDYYSSRLELRQLARDGVVFMNAAVAESMPAETAGKPVTPPAGKEKKGELAEVAVEGLLADERGGPPQKEEKPSIDLSQVKVRSNLNETVFFYPHLMTDAEGNVLIKFTMNEALTKWKFLALAHTKSLQTAATIKEVVTQKELMVLPNPPRFFRENDEIEFTAKVSNLTDKALTGEAKLELVDALTGKPLNWQEITQNDVPQQVTFTAAAGQSARLAWRFKVPDVADVPVIEHTVVASSGEFSDGEKSAAPVLSNRMLVTETLPLPVRGKETRTFVFKSLNDNNSKTLRHQAMTLEFTQNPAWYAVQALPYLMEYPYECTEQIFARYYANSLATSVANSHPKIKQVFDRWRAYEPAALLSNLSKNQELKTALLEETPWVLHAQSEELQKQNIALLFDLNRMSYEQEASLAKLLERQLANGGWAWFPGGEDNWYITQYIVEGMGHLQKLGVQDLQKNPLNWRMVQNAVRYCDARLVERYERLEDLVKAGKAKWEDDHLDYMASHYLYTRSFFLEDKSARASVNGKTGPDAGREYIGLEGKAAIAHAFYTGQAEKFWLNKGMYTEGMLSLALNRTGKAEAASGIVRSLRERSLNNPELGMYWKYPTGYWWYTAPIETHSIMIETFNDVAQDTRAVDDLKVWLLKNKQTNHWKTTKATALAVYALLSTGDNWLLDDQPLSIMLGSASGAQANVRTDKIAQAQRSAEAGTGYFKVRFDGADVQKDMASISISNPNNAVAWGAAYWQYFEQLDKITTFEETPLTLKKQLFRVKNSPTGEVLHPVNEGDALKVGEKLKVRIELRVDRDMEYVHMKDMRASGFEPLNVLSSYKWQGGLGYYESTRDASTNFFFSWLPKGTHVFEYPLRVVHKGNFSNGITTIQCMYAPEFSSHSEGVRVRVSD